MCQYCGFCLQGKDHQWKWNPGPPSPPASFPFLPGYGTDKDSAECRAGNTVEIKPHHLHPAGCKKEVICGLVLLNGDLTSSGE